MRSGKPDSVCDLQALKKVEIEFFDKDSWDVSYYFAGSDEPFVKSEFRAGTPTAQTMDQFEGTIEVALLQLLKVMHGSE